MENFDFNEQQFQPRNQSGLPGQTGIIGWMINKGIAKDVKSANYILLVVMALTIILMFVVYFNFIKQPSVDVSPADNLNFDPALIP